MTARDAEILRMVNRHRFLRSHQIAELVGGSRHGYVERPACQIDYYRRAGSRSIAYGLTSRGAAHLRSVDNTPFSRLDWTSRNRAIKRLFLEHALMVSDIMVALEIACRKRDDVRFLIEHEIPLPASAPSQRAPFQWTVTGSGNEKLGVIPDRVFALEFGDNSERILCFLEADRGTMPIERATHDASSIARKLHAYAQTWNSGIHRSRFGISRVRVLTVTTSASRLENLTAAAAELEHGKGLFLFTNAAAVSFAADLLALPWRKNDGSTEPLLAHTSHRW
jgi:hypothetical protein